MTTPSILAVLPFRLQSSRLKEKMLARIGQDELCVHTARRALKAFEGQTEVEVLAAVDSEKVAMLLRKKLPTLQVLLTDPALASGTDRVLAAARMHVGAARLSQLRGVLNIQGDMPYLGKAPLQQLTNLLLQNPENILERAQVFTLCQPFFAGSKLGGVAAQKAALKLSYQSYISPSAVKVLKDREGFALYFSRFSVPYSREKLRLPKISASQKIAKSQLESAHFQADYHLGVYAYTPKALVEFCSQSPIPLERAEGLEQLRSMWLGHRIFVLEAAAESGTSFRGIDVASDLAWARKNFKKFGCAL